MIKKNFLLFLLFSSFVFSFTPPKVETNKIMMDIIIRDFENVLSGFNGNNPSQIKRIISDADSIGIDLLPYIENLEEKFTTWAKNTIENGDAYSYEKISKYGNKYKVNIDVTKKDIQKLAQKGIENAFRKSSSDATAFISFAKENGIALLINKETILEPLKEGIENSIYQNFKIDTDLLMLAEEYGITLSDKELTKAVQKSIIKIFSGKKRFYIEERPSIKNIKKIEKSCLKNNIDFNLSEITGIEELIHQNFDHFMTPEALEYFNQRGIKIDFSKIDNLDKIVEKEILQSHKLYFQRLAWHNFDNENNSYKKNKQLEFIFDVAEKNNIKIEDENIKPKLQKILENYIEYFVEENESAKIEFTNNYAKENDIDIKPYLIEVIQENIVEKMEEHICWHYSEEDLKKTISIATEYGAALDFYEIIKEAMKKKISQAETEDFEKILNYAVENNIDLSFEDMAPQYIMNGLIEGIENTNIGQIEGFMEYTESKGFISDLNKAFHETAKLYIETANIGEIAYLLEFAEEQNVEIDLKNITNIENAFYVGFAKALKHKSYFAYQYLLQLALDNDIKLNKEMLMIFDNTSSSLKKPLCDDFRLFIYPDYIVKYLEKLSWL